MITRQQATALAIEWAEEAETQHTTHPARADAQGMALMWARIAELLPAVLDEQQLLDGTCPSRHQTADGIEPCTKDDTHSGYHRGVTTRWTDAEAQPQTCGLAFPDLGFVDHPGHCILPADHQLPHRNETGARWTPVDPAIIRAHFPNHLQDQANAATSTTSPDQPPVQLPGQRPHTEDQEPRCLSRYQAAAGVERCEREAGHPGAHHGVTVGWRTEQAIVGPDYSAAEARQVPDADRCAGCGHGPTWHEAGTCRGNHNRCTCEEFAFERAAREEQRPAAPYAGLCCQGAVAAAAEQLLHHAQTAPGLAEPERRCLEDAADYVRAHIPPATYPAAEAPCELWIAGEPHAAHTFVSQSHGPARCPGWSRP